MKLYKTKTKEYVKLTIDEEYAMARWVMDVLCLRWIDTREGFQEFMTRLFRSKCHGNDFGVADMDRLCDYLDRYGDLLPKFPKLDDNDTAIVVPREKPDGTIYTSDEIVEYIIWHIRLAWREIWEQHPYIKTRAGVGIFPGDDPTDEYIAKQEAMEDAFWSEVDSKQAEYGCGRAEAIRAVSDYKPRPAIKYQSSDPRC